MNNNLFQDILKLIWMGLGLLLAGIIEGYIWKTNWFDYFNYPISKELFGENKRWRGLITLPLTNTFSTFLFQLLEQRTFLGNYINLLSDFNFLNTAC